MFARLRSFAFNIPKVNQTSTLSQDRYRAALAGIDNLLSRHQSGALNNPV